MYDITTSGGRRKLSHILNGGADNFTAIWETTEAAGDFAPLPAGTYQAKLMAGLLSTSKSGTPGYKLTFKVVDGDHAGRQIWHDLWLTPAAMAMTKRDLAKIGVTSPTQLDQPLPAVLRCDVKVSLRTGDDAKHYNAVKSFAVTGIDTGDDADFGAPAPTAPTPPLPATSTTDEVAADTAAGRLFAPQSVSPMEDGR